MEKQFNPFSLDGKVVVISGAASGIGRQCAINCSKMGAKLILLDINENGLNETLGMVDGGTDHYCAVVDLTDYESVPKVISEGVAHVGRISGLLNCAGISTTLPLNVAKLETLDRFFQVNVYSAYFLTQTVCKVGNFSKEGGSIVFFSSVVGQHGETCKSIYGMTKGALFAGAKSLACELARKNIRVNSISPGVVVTPINEKLPHISDPEMRKQTEALHLLGLGDPNDIANACIYLLSDASRWVTGSNLVVDGGYTTR